MLRTLSGADLRALKVFQTVAEAGGFTAAQIILNVSQPTISTQITNLETRLGFKLCERGRSGFRLTDRGRSVLRHYAQLTDQTNLFCQEMSSLAGRMVGELKIGLIDTIVHNETCHISDAIRAFRSRNQEVNLRIFVGTYQRLERYLVENRLDVAVAIFPTRLKTINYIDLFQEVQAIYCGREHPYFGRPAKDVSDLELQSADWVDTGYIVEQCQKYMPPSPHSTAMAPNLEAIVHFLLSGCHVGYLPIDYAKNWEETGYLWRLSQEKFSYCATFSVAHMGKKTSNQMLSAFLEDLQAAHGIADTPQ